MAIAALAVFAADETPVVRGAGKVSLVKSDGAWQLLVDRRIYIVKGIEYGADPIGKRREGSNSWMDGDLNGNGRRDGPYDSWIDANRNNFQDADEQTVGDFFLLKRLGCNTIRIYHPDGLNEAILRDMYENYGIMAIMGNLLGAYTVDTGADWKKGTDYTNSAQKKRMKENVREMVLKYKDEQFVLMWMLGNENDAVGSYENSTFNNTNASKHPEAFAKFVGETARMIKELDPDHPVGVCLAYYKMLPYLKKYAPEVDIIGMNAYTGPYGFGTLWGRIKAEFDRPVIITEYGVDSYNQRKNTEDEDFQAAYHRKAWQDIVSNSYFGDKEGNAVGGVVFGFVDKWWFCGSPAEHDVEKGAWQGPSNDGYINDEWLGICGQGNGTRSPFLRQPKKAYYVYKDELWNKTIEDLEAEKYKRMYGKNANGTNDK